MQEIKNKIIETLINWDNIKNYKKDSVMEYIGVWFGYKFLSKDTGYSIKELKKAMKELSDEGKVQHLYTSSDESRIAGSGWFLL